MKNILNETEEGIRRYPKRNLTWQWIIAFEKTARILKLIRIAQILISFLTQSTQRFMSSSEVLQKYKGLINGKDWESGSLRRYKNGLTAICRKTNLFYVFEDSVSEYTGFKNALGEEIYEGDLLAVSDKNEKEIYIVYWDETCHQWKVGSSLFQDPLCNRLLESCLDSTLLGHIFTHQHLLISQREIVPERKIK